MGTTALGRALRNHPLVALTAFLAVALATLWAAFSPPTRFEAASVVSVQPSATNVSTQSVEYIIPSVEQRIASSAFRTGVRDQLPTPLRSGDWSVATTTSPGSGVLRISISSTRRDLVMPVANAYATFLTMQKLSKIPVEVVVVNPASGSLSLSHRTTVLVSGFGLAAILAGLAALVRLSWADAPLAAAGSDGMGAPVSVASRLADPRGVRRRDQPLRGSQPG